MTSRMIMMIVLIAISVAGHFWASRRLRHIDRRIGELGEDIRSARIDAEIGVSVGSQIREDLSALRADLPKRRARKAAQEGSRK